MGEKNVFEEVAMGMKPWGFFLVKKKGEMGVGNADHVYAAFSLFYPDTQVLIDGQMTRLSVRWGWGLHKPSAEGCGVVEEDKEEEEDNPSCTRHCRSTNTKHTEFNYPGFQLPMLLGSFTRLPLTWPGFLRL